MLCIIEKPLSALFQRYQQKYMWTQALASTKEKTTLGVAPKNFANMSEYLTFKETDLDGKILIPDIGAMLGFAGGKENQFRVFCPISDILYVALWCDEPKVEIILNSEFFTFGKGGKTNGKINIKAEKRKFFKLSEDREETISSEDVTIEVESNMQIGSEILDGQFERSLSSHPDDAPPMEEIHGDPEKDDTINQYMKDMERYSKLPKPNFLPQSDIDISTLSISKDKTSSLPTDATPEKAATPPEKAATPPEKAATPPNLPTQLNDKEYVDPSQSLFDDFDSASETEIEHDKAKENEKNEKDTNPIYVFEEPVVSKQEMDCKVKFFEDKVILSSNETQKTIPILSKAEAEMEKLFDNKMKPSRTDREVQWEKLLPAFNVTHLFHPNCSEELKKRVLENDQLYLVDMKHLWNSGQKTEIPVYWEQICKCNFPEVLGYALFDKSHTIMPFTGKISKK